MLSLKSLVSKCSLCRIRVRKRTKIKLMTKISSEKTSSVVQERVPANKASNHRDKSSVHVQGLRRDSATSVGNEIGRHGTDVGLLGEIWERDLSSYIFCMSLKFWMPFAALVEMAPAELE
jgi:hypothetical protein